MISKALKNTNGKLTWVKYPTKEGESNINHYVHKP